MLTLLMALQLGVAFPGPGVKSYSGGGSNPTFVQANQCKTGTASCNLTFTVGAGNRVAVFMNGSQNGTNSISFSNGDTCANVIAPHTFVNSKAEACLVTTSTGGSTTVTCSSTSTTFQLGCVAYEYSGGVGALDTSGNSDHSNGSGLTVSSAIIVTGVTNTLVVGYFSSASNDYGATTTGGGYTIPANADQHQSDYASTLNYIVAPSISGYQPLITVTTDRDILCFTAAFK